MLAGGFPCTHVGEGAPRPAPDPALLGYAVGYICRQLHRVASIALLATHDGLLPQATHRGPSTAPCPARARPVAGGVAGRPPGGAQVTLASAACPQGRGGRVKDTTWLALTCPALDSGSRTRGQGPANRGRTRGAHAGLEPATQARVRRDVRPARLRRRAGAFPGPGEQRRPNPAGSLTRAGCNAIADTFTASLGTSGGAVV